MGVGIYVEEENKFIFNNVIVGRTAKARFKLMNTNKVILHKHFKITKLKLNKTKNFRYQSI